MNNRNSLYPSNMKPVYQDQLATLADLTAFKISLLEKLSEGNSSILNNK
jgi:hypothetical protein